MLRNRRVAGEHHVDPSSQQIGHGRSRPFVGNVSQFGAGHYIDHLAKQMIDRSIARRSKGHGRIGLGQRQKFFECGGLDAVAHHAKEWHRCDGGDRNEILDRVVVEVLIDADIDRLRALVRHQEGIAISG
ncbi:hypothetical protein D3C85_1405250 [compost metagenome]